MALIKCPDCQKDVSSQAESCLHCGCPISKKNNTNQNIGLPIDILCYIIMVAAYIVYFVVNEPTCGLICCIVFTLMSLIPVINGIIQGKIGDKSYYILGIKIYILFITILCFIGFADGGFTW